MNDKNVIKGLECCTYNGCSECPYKSEGEYCTRTRNKAAVALIYHQNAEIAKLKKANSTLEKQFYIKGIKDFAKLLIDKSAGGFVYLSDIADYALEMAGEIE